MKTKKQNKTKTDATHNNDNSRYRLFGVPAVLLQFGVDFC